MCGSIFPMINNVLILMGFPWKFGIIMPFYKPWFLILTTFFGMGLMFLIYIVMKCCKSSENSPRNRSDLFLFRSLFAPAILNILSSILQSYALFFMPLTVWQLFHGFQVLFATLFSVTYLRKALYLVDWLGLFVTVLGICTAGVSALLRGLNESDVTITQLFFSFLMVILSHGIKSFQMIMEEELIRNDGASPVEITTFEGIWGVFIIGFIILPICNILPSKSGICIYENTVEIYEILKLSTRLITLVVLYMGCTTFYNYCGIVVTSFSSALHRALYEMFRPFIILAVSAFAFYFTEYKAIGEKMDRFSIIEFIGFFIAVIGTLIYNKTIELPCFFYNDTSDDIVDIKKNLV